MNAQRKTNILFVLIHVALAMSFSRSKKRLDFRKAIKLMNEAIISSIGCIIMLYSNVIQTHTVYNRCMQVLSISHLRLTSRLDAV